MPAPARLVQTVRERRSIVFGERAYAATGLYCTGVAMSGTDRGIYLHVFPVLNPCGKSGNDQATALRDARY
eukprot:477539-Rhodomonas_salina.1